MLVVFANASFSVHYSLVDVVAIYEVSAPASQGVFLRQTALASSHLRLNEGRIEGWTTSAEERVALLLLPQLLLLIVY